MIKFNNFLTEAKTSIDAELLGHLTHVKDLPHELPDSGGNHALSLMQDFHKHRMGEPSGVRGQLKVDGGASVVIGHDHQGPFVSDKHRFSRGVKARSPEEVDHHFGHAPQYAATLKNVLSHGHKLVNPGHTVQGDLLYNEHEKPTLSKGVASATPNRIEYGMDTKAKVGLAAHTEITQGIAHAITPEATKRHKDIFTTQSEYKPDPSTYKPKDREAVEKHLSSAKELLSKHTTNHLTPDHTKHLTSYLNNTTREGGDPSTEGYKKHLSAVGKKEASKLSTVAGQQRKLSTFASHSGHVDKHAEHFNRSLVIQHHLGQATEHLLKGVHHPDVTTSIDGNPSPGEGIVLLKKDRLGLHRPVGKLVPKEVSHALLNNPKYPQK